MEDEENEDWYSLLNNGNPYGKLTNNVTDGAKIAYMK